MKINLDFEKIREFAKKLDLEGIVESYIEAAEKGDIVSAARLHLLECPCGGPYLFKWLYEEVAEFTFECVNKNGEDVGAINVDATGAGLDPECDTARIKCPICGKIIVEP